jgi:membrane-associated phospholipid phosphatase
MCSMREAHIGSVLSARMRVLWREKLILIGVLTVLMGSIYFASQRFPYFSPKILYPSVVDRWIPFDDHFVWLYQSMYLLNPLAPVLMVTIHQIRTYAVGFVGIGLVCNSIFVLSPTEIVRPIHEGTNWMYQILIGYDGVGNAFPSLHVAWACYATLACQEVFDAVDDRFAWRGLLFLWLIGIVVSTLVTKQHVVQDIIAGAAIGVVGYWVMYGGLVLSLRRVAYRDKPEWKRKKAPLTREEKP